MTEEAIFQEMLTFFQEQTGYEMREEADLAVRLRAAARQIASLYHYSDYVFRQAFLQTAEGENLDKHGALRGVERAKARCAEGTLRFGISKALPEPLTIPAGTVCLTENWTAFETTEDGVLKAGNLTTDVAARAVEAGSSGNVLAGQIVAMQTKPDGIETVTNVYSFTGGREAETDERYRERILAAYRGLSNGTNIGYYQQLALSVEGVDYAEVIPRVNGIGTVGVVVSTESGTVPASVIAEVNERMAQRRELGITVTVSTPTKLEVSIEATLQTAEGYTLAQAQESVEAALRACFSGNQIGKTIYRNGLIAAAMNTGMIHDITLTSPASDVKAMEKQRPVLRSIILEGA